MNKKSKMSYVHHGSGIGEAPINLRDLIRSVVEEGNYTVTVLFMRASKSIELFDDIDCKKNSF